jgi:hypothetical protein
MTDRPWDGDSNFIDQEGDGTLKVRDIYSIYCLSCHFVNFFFLDSLANQQQFEFVLSLASRA